MIRNKLDSKSSQTMREILKAKIATLQHKVDQFTKAWSDEARAASIEARQRHGAHKQKADDTIGAKGQAAVHNAHSAAAEHYKAAAEHFEGGNKEAGDKSMQQGEKHGAKATAAEDRRRNDGGLRGYGEIRDNRPQQVRGRR